jgi:putative peptide maturation system protein
MMDTLQQVLVASLDYLLTLSREAVRPEEARVGLRLLQGRYPNTRMNLVWEEEAYDRSVHYDMLLHLAGEGTVSLSFCPERTLPWPLRGVQRRNEADLVRVNNTVLRVDQAVACLDFIWGQAPILNRLVNLCLIREALDQDPVQLSAAELQQALDAFRRVHQLHKVADTCSWMERRGLTQERLECLVAGAARTAKLRDRVAAGRVEGYFERHRPDFDTACIARIEFPDGASAHRTAEKVRTGGVDFYEAAQRRFLAGAERPDQPPTALFAVLQRRQAPAELGAAVFAAKPGDVQGPVPTGEGYTLVRMLSLTSARLDALTHLAIKDILFEEWLEERRQAAQVEWYWGTQTRGPP